MEKEECRKGLLSSLGVVATKERLQQAVCFHGSDRTTVSDLEEKEEIAITSHDSVVGVTGGFSGRECCVALVVLFTPTSFTSSVSILSLLLLIWAVCF